MDIEPGTLIDNRYRIERRMATGATSEVYVGRDERLERPVALKILHGETGDRRRFSSEVRLLAALDHPNLVRVYDVVEEPDLAVLVMELIEGPSLAQRLREGRLRPAAVRQLGLDMAACLAYLHERNVLHRDIKPANILFDGLGRARLADFGIARLVDDTRLTNAGQAIGTFAYMAPEQLTGAPVGPPADIYALGLVLLEALTGQRAFGGTGSEAVAARLARDPVIPPELNGPWSRLLTRMTARDPALRPTASEIAASLGAPADTADTTMAFVPPPPLPPVAVVDDGARPFSPWLLAAGLVLAAAVVVVIGLLASRSGGGPKTPAAATIPPTSTVTTSTTAVSVAPTTIPPETTAAPVTTPPVTAPPTTRPPATAPPTTSTTAPTTTMFPTTSPPTTSLAGATPQPGPHRVHG